MGARVTLAEGCHLNRKTDDLVRAAKTREIFGPKNQRRSLKGYVLVRLKDGNNKSWGGFSPVAAFPIRLKVSSSDA